MKRRRALAAVGAALCVLLPQTAPAAHEPGCGGSWSSKASCLYAPNALSIRIWGDSVATGTATVHVWISTRPTVGQVAVTIIECTASGAGYAICDKQLGPEQRIYGPEVPLACHVEGNGAGDYFCSYPSPA